MLLPEEIEEERDASSLDLWVDNCHGGRSKIIKIFRTIPLDTWEIYTENGKRLKASPRHMVLTTEGYVPIAYLEKEDTIITEDGEDHLKFVNYVGRQQLYDIQLEGDPSYFSNGIGSHNSTTFIARQLLYSHINHQGYSSLYVVPHYDHLNTYAHRYEEMEALWRFKLGRQLKLLKRYGRSKVELAYCGESSLSIRGKTVDEVLIDEAQSFDAGLLGDVLYTQTTSPMPMTIYAGTAMSIDTLLEAKWQDSSMGVWMVRAMDGSHWINMYDVDTLFKVCSKSDGPTCPYTGRRLDVLNGHYEHTNKEALFAGRIGIHVPQCIISDIANDPIQWMKLYTNVKSMDASKTIQESFGIAVSAGAREVTEQDLQQLCTLDKTEAELKSRCEKGYYRLIVSGCDWGGSDYNPDIKTKKSYTVHCILGLAPDGATDILHYRRYAGMDYPSIVNSILHDHKEWHGMLLASDFGVGLAYNMELRKSVPWDRHFIMNYVGPNAAPLSEPKGDHLPNQLSLNRTEAITTVFRDAKAYAPQRIRCRSWEQFRPYLLDWTNLFRAPVETESGAKKFKYIRAATKADDALHAFTFAYTLIKFAMGEPIVQDPSLEARLRQIMRDPMGLHHPIPVRASDMIMFG